MEIRQVAGVCGIICVLITAISWVLWNMNVFNKFQFIVLTIVSQFGFFLNVGIGSYYPRNVNFGVKT